MYFIYKNGKKNVSFSDLTFDKGRTAGSEDSDSDSEDSDSAGSEDSGSSLKVQSHCISISHLVEVGL